LTNLNIYELVNEYDLREQNQTQICSWWWCGITIGTANTLVCFDAAQSFSL